MPKPEHQNPCIILRILWRYWTFKSFFICTCLYHFFLLSIYSLQCIRCLLQIFWFWAFDIFVLGGKKLRHFKQISTLQYLLSIFHTKIVFKQHTDVKQISGSVIQPSTNIYCVVEFFLLKWTGSTVSCKMISNAILFITFFRVWFWIMF